MVDMPARLCLVGLPRAVRSAGSAPDRRPSGRRRRWRHGGFFRIRAHRLAAARWYAEPARGRRINGDLAGGPTRLWSIGVVCPRAVRCRERAVLLPLPSRRPHPDPATSATAPPALAPTAARRITLYASAARRDAASARLGSRAALRKTGGPCRSTPSTSDDGGFHGSTVTATHSSIERHQ